VNGPLPDGVATAARGVRALTEQGMRVALVEGDWMGRQVWDNHQVGTLGTFSLPMTIQTLSMEFMSPVTELQGLGDFWTWTPTSDVSKLIKGEVTNLPKQVKDVVKRMFDNDVVEAGQGDGQRGPRPGAPLPREAPGLGSGLYGESFIEPAKLGDPLRRAVSEHRHGVDGEHHQSA
jgi:hypothetical protein